MMIIQKEITIDSVEKGNRGIQGRRPVIVSCSIGDRLEYDEHLVDLSFCCTNVNQPIVGRKVRVTVEWVPWIEERLESPLFAGITPDFPNSEEDSNASDAGN